MQKCFCIRLNINYSSFIRNLKIINAIKNKIIFKIIKITSRILPIIISPTSGLYLLLIGFTINNLKIYIKINFNFYKIILLICFFYSSYDAGIYYTILFIGSTTTLF